MTEDKRVLSDDERRELARRDRAALLVYQTLREDEKATIDRVCRDAAHRFTETDNGPRREATGGTWDCYLARKKERAFRDYMERHYALAISDSVADPRGAEDAAIAAAGGVTFTERLADRIEGRKAPQQARSVVRQARSVRDGQLAAAGHDRWEEGRE